MWMYGRLTMVIIQFEYPIYGQEHKYISQDSSILLSKSLTT